MHYYFDDGASAKDGRKKGRIMWNDATAAALLRVYISNF
jgi:hypothetical protein